MPTDTTEKGLETLIMRHMTGEDGFSFDGKPVINETPDGIAADKAGGNGWHAGPPNDYDRAHCIDVSQLFKFLLTTQPDTLAKLNIGNYRDAKNITRQKFLARISSEIAKRGVIDVLRNGIADGPLRFEMFYGTPSPGNDKAAERFAQNRFSITRQLRYSHDETRRSLDLAAFINGLPVSTFELKNSPTKQTVEDAVGNTAAIAIHAKNSSASVAAWFTSPWMTRKSGCARN
jgi:type I restriction enzyme R subunit